MCFSHNSTTPLRPTQVSCAPYLHGKVQSSFKVEVSSNHSVSSTFSVAGSIAKSKRPSTQSTKREKTKPNLKRRFRIDESHNQHFENFSRCSEDCFETWYTAKDYQNMRIQMDRTTLELRQKNEQQRFGLDSRQIHRASIPRVLFNLLAAISYELDDVSSILNEEVKTMLRQLYAPVPLYRLVEEEGTEDHSSLELIGLENCADTRMRRKVKEHKIKLQEVVAEVQSELKACVFSSRSEYDEELRDSCIALSQPFVLLAQLKAHAQAQASTTQIKNNFEM